MRNIDIITDFDFYDSIEWRWKISNDKSIIAIDNYQNIEYFHQRNITEMYKPVKQVKIMKTKGFIRHCHKNGIFKVVFIEENEDIKNDEESSQGSKYDVLPKAIYRLIVKGQVYVATDASINRQIIGGS